MKCNNCGHEAKDTDKYCFNCGNSLLVEKDILNCEKCGAVVNEKDKFCGECGRKLVEDIEIIEATEVKKYCKICNSVVEENDNYCLSCGARIKDVSEIDENQKGPIITGYVSQVAIWLSIAALSISFLLSSFGMLLPIITGVLSLGALGFAIYKYIRVNHRLNVWAIVLSVLAILVSGIGITNNLVEKDYAYKIPKEVGEVIGIEFPDVEPSFYNIEMMDGNITSVVYKEYASNEVVLKLSIDQAMIFQNKYGNLFNSDYRDNLEENFKVLFIDDSYVSVVYDLNRKSFGFPSETEEYDIIVINYYLDEDWVQILEISKWSN